MPAARLILVGRVGGAHGIRGELRIAAFTASPEALLQYKAFKREDGSAGLTLVSGRGAKANLIARARGVDTRDQAEALKGLDLYVARDDLPALEEDEFYLADLIGLEARDRTDAVVGRIKAVENFGAGDLLEIEPVAGGANWWLPFTREAVPEIHIDLGRVIIERPAETD